MSEEDDHLHILKRLEALREPVEPKPAHIASPKLALKARVPFSEEPEPLSPPSAEQEMMVSIWAKVIQMEDLNTHEMVDKMWAKVNKLKERMNDFLERTAGVAQDKDKDNDDDTESMHDWEIINPKDHESAFDFDFDMHDREMPPARHPGPTKGR